MKKKNIIFITSLFLIIFISIMFLPNIASFITDIRDGEIDWFNSSNKTNGTLEITEDSLKNQVSGDTVCYILSESDSLKYGYAMGLSFDNDMLITVDRYLALLYKNTDLYESSISAYDSLEKSLNAEKGVSGTTKVYDSGLVLDYKFDLTKFDYSKAVEYGSGASFSLPFISLNKKDVLLQAAVFDMHCGENSITLEEKREYYASDDKVVSETDFIEIGSSAETGYGDITIKEISINYDESYTNVTFMNNAEGTFAFGNNEYFIEIYNKDKQIILSYPVVYGITIKPTEEYTFSVTTSSLEKDIAMYIRISKREY